MSSVIPLNSLVFDQTKETQPMADIKAKIEAETENQLYLTNYVIIKRAELEEAERAFKVSEAKIREYMRAYMILSKAEAPK